MLVANLSREMDGDLFGVFDDDASALSTTALVAAVKRTRDEAEPDRMDVDNDSEDDQAGQSIPGSCLSTIRLD